MWTAKWHTAPPPSTHAVSDKHTTHAKDGLDVQITTP